MIRSSGKPDGNGDYPFWRRNTYSLSLAALISTTGFGVSFPFLPLIIRDLGIRENPEVWVGYIVGSFFAVGFLTTPFWGGVADHFGRKSMVLRTSLGMGLINLLLPLAPNPIWFLAIYLLMGTTNGFVPASQALVATTTPPRKMGIALSFLHSGTWLGNSIGPVIAILIAGLLPSYRYLFWVTGGLVLSAGALALIFTREQHTRPEIPFRPHLLRDLLIIFKIPGMPLLFLITFIFAITYLGNIPVVSVFTLKILEAGGEVSKSTEEFWVGMVALALPVSSAVAAPVWGKYLDSSGGMKILTIGLFTGTLASLAIIFVETPLQLALSRALLGMLAVGIGLSTLTTVKALAPKRMEGRVLAFATAFAMLGFGGGPFAAGIIGPWLGLRTYFAINSGILACALLLVIFKLAPRLRFKSPAPPEI